MDTSCRQRKFPSGLLNRCACDINTCQEHLWLPVAKMRSCFVFRNVSARAKTRVTYVAFVAHAGRLSANLVDIWSVRWLECGVGRLTNNQLIALSKEEHAELNGHESERAEERLINILLGPRGYMTGGGVYDGAKTLAGKKERSVLSCREGGSVFEAVTISARMAWTVCSFWLITLQHFSAMIDAYQKTLDTRWTCKYRKRQNNETLGKRGLGGVNVAPCASCEQKQAELRKRWGTRTLHLEEWALRSGNIEQATQSKRQIFMSDCSKSRKLQGSWAGGCCSKQTVWRNKRELCEPGTENEAHALPRSRWHVGINPGIQWNCIRKTKQKTKTIKKQCSTCGSPDVAARDCSLKVKTKE